MICKTKTARSNRIVDLKKRAIPQISAIVVIYLYSKEALPQTQIEDRYEAFVNLKHSFTERTQPKN